MWALATTKNYLYLRLYPLLCNILSIKRTHFIRSRSSYPPPFIAEISSVIPTIATSCASVISSFIFLAIIFSAYHFPLSNIVIMQKTTNISPKNFKEFFMSSNYRKCKTRHSETLISTQHIENQLFQCYIVGIANVTVKRLDFKMLGSLLRKTAKPDTPVHACAYVYARMCARMRVCVYVCMYCFIYLRYKASNPLNINALSVTLTCYALLHFFERFDFQRFKRNVKGYAPKSPSLSLDLKNPDIDTMIHIDTKQAISDLRNHFRYMAKHDFDLGVSRALNRSMAKGKTSASQQIRRHYKIKASDLNKTMSISKAFPRKLSSGLSLKGAPIGIYKFSAKARKTGVSFNISGTRKTIQGAFMAKTKSGHTGVFARGKYSGRGFKFRSKRIASGSKFRMVNGRPVPVDAPDVSITELRTLSTPVMFGQSKVNEVVVDDVSKHFEQRLAHELKHLNNKHY